MMAIRNFIAVFLLLVTVIISFPAAGYCKVRIYPVPFVPYGADLRQGSFGTEQDILHGTNPQYAVNRAEGLRFRNLPADSGGVYSGTITLYSSLGQEVYVADYTAASKNIFTFDSRFEMLPSGIYIWVARPSSGSALEKGKLIILK